MPKHTGRLTGAADYLKASYIKRWGIVHTAETQSIGLHMYRVWILVRQWGPEIGLNTKQQQQAEEWALTHDLAEIRTGDMPTPHKTPEVKSWLEGLELEICPEAAAVEHAIKGTITGDFCKFCDTAEAVLYLRNCGLGQHARDVLKLLEVQMYDRLKGSSLPEEAKAFLVTAFTNTYHDV